MPAAGTAQSASLLQALAFALSLTRCGAWMATLSSSIASCSRRRDCIARAGVRYDTNVDELGSVLWIGLWVGKRLQRY